MININTTLKTFAYPISNPFTKINKIVNAPAEELLTIDSEVVEYFEFSFDDMF